MLLCPFPAFPLTPRLLLPVPAACPCPLLTHPHTRTQLYHMRFTPLRTMVTPVTAKPRKPRNPWLHWAGVGLLTYGTLAAAGLAHRRLAEEGKSPLSQMKDPVAQAVVGDVDAVGQSAVKVVSTAADAVQSPGQTAAAVKSAAQKGVSAAQKGVSVTVEGSGQAAAAIGRQVGKVADKIGGAGSGADDPSDVWGVHGEVPPRHKKNVFARVRDGVVKRTLGLGVFLSKPFTHVLGHQVKGTAAESLGAF